jgi:hypothetical protein
MLNTATTQLRIASLVIALALNEKKEQQVLFARKWQKNACDELAGACR